MIQLDKTPDNNIFRKGNEERGFIDPAKRGS